MHIFGEQCRGWRFAFIKRDDVGKWRRANRAEFPPRAIRFTSVECVLRNFIFGDGFIFDEESSTAARDWIHSYDRAAVARVGVRKRLRRYSE